MTEPLTFALDRGRTLLVTPAPVTPVEHLTGTTREALATVADEHGRNCGRVERAYWGALQLTWPNGFDARLTNGERERLNALFDPRRVSDLPAWDELHDLDKGAALLHVWKRRWEGAGYAREHYPARYLDDSRLVALPPELACRHAVIVARYWDFAVDRLGMDEVERLYYGALVEEDRRRGVVRQTSPAYSAALAAAGGVG
ncbi:hypothetical protein ACG83_10920 [Frankia sp. R43]|uniref:hypothetical protein n=1 Tax=Frankia sp. R43 TaxID=269536 RepID=UPI0006C9EDBF|nr:hypothetical protein [Frankia sp. R43]KPM55777.1 hypothetical protein ACG83_10920 [Frankia sp. R43]